MAWNIGANDVANAMGTSGSRALTLKQAVIIEAAEFMGAFFAGDAVTDTVRKGLYFDTDAITSMRLLMIDVRIHCCYDGSSGLDYNRNQIWIACIYYTPIIGGIVESISPRWPI